MVAAFKANPNYAIMRGAARFRSVNGVVKGAKGLIEGKTYHRRLAELKSQLAQSAFANIDAEGFIGLGGLRLRALARIDRRREQKG